MVLAGKLLSATACSPCDRVRAYECLPRWEVEGKRPCTTCSLQASQAPRASIREFNMQQDRVEGRSIACGTTHNTTWVLPRHLLRVKMHTSHTGHSNANKNSLVGLWGKVVAKLVMLCCLSCHAM
jgi:hypothetical protein